MFLNLCFLIIIYLFVQIKSNDLELEFLAVIFRHGDRIPESGEEKYPNNPNTYYDYYPISTGGLTNNGKMREYKLGEYLRNRYNDFLGDYYTPENVMARSVEFDRSKMSLQLVLSSLYPPKKDQIWNQNLNWQPISIVYIPKVFDILMIPEECPQYMEELGKVRNLPEVVEKVDKFRPLMEKLTPLTGKLINSTANLYDLYHSLMADYMGGKKIHDWALEIMPDGPLLDATILEYDTVSYNTKLKRLFGGMFIRHLTDLMTDKIENENSDKPKINLFSSRETNIAALLKALGVFKPHVPSYSSAVIFELLSNETDNYIGMSYYLGIPAISKEIQIPGCSNPCPFGDFMTLMKDLIPSDKEMECEKGGSLYRDPIIFGKMEFKFLVFLLITNFIASVISNDYELKFVAVVFRHGDRTPENNEVYPNDPYLHDDFHPLGRGQLTVAGKQREYQLGQALRYLYNDFLGDIYVPKDLVARSTETVRTRMSLQLVVAAMYPPKGVQVWNDTLNWQPILTSYVPEIDDSLLKADLCPQYKEEYERVIKLPEFKRELEKFRPLMKNLTAVTGKEISTSNDLFLLYNGLTALKSMNRQLPKWSEEIFPYGALLDGANLEFKSLFYNDNLKRLRSGMVLKNFTDTMSEIVNGKLRNHQKMNIFSAHDANVASLLAVLSDLDPHVPKFASSVMVELIQKNNNYFVKVRHFLGIPPTVIDLQIPGCDSWCPFNDFMKLMKNYLPSDEETKCEKNNQQFDSIVINYPK
ncbi:uncharacterized protein LOC130675706 [Microplitis mediator]|uniref:uncharacterized protein LOC130675706 n=1 Tax=Microplitis mediator TaxID=375433 RepID=UPI002556F029|nr:uncharacterized protein LOC130675706 [Microplitis mediator]